jgi:peptidoglycan/xylan/chitin deacetylase (PgdA/CDA1 family)
VIHSMQLTRRATRRSRSRSGAAPTVGRIDASARPPGSKQSHVRGAAVGLTARHAARLAAVIVVAILLGTTFAACDGAAFRPGTPAGGGPAVGAQPGNDASATAPGPTGLTSSASTDGSGSAEPPFPSSGGGWPPLSAGTVPILYYHHVDAPPPAYASWSRERQRAFITYDVLPTALEAQLDWLVAHGYTTILPRDLAAHWDLGTPLPARPVILTFDDGFHDWATTVLPMLDRRHMVAEFYLTLTAIANKSITWPEVQSLAAAGNGIGAHDVHHVQLTRLGAGRPPASAAVMWAEVDGARRTIEAHLGIAPDSMAYVGGGFDARLEALVKQAGYTTARTIVRGIVQMPAHRFELHVVRIGPYDDVADLVTGSMVAGLPTFAARMAGVSDR